MADIDINPVGYHDKTEAQLDKIIPLTPGGGSTWEPE